MKIILKEYIFFLILSSLNIKYDRFLRLTSAVGFQIFEMYNNLQNDVGNFKLKLCIFLFSDEGPCLTYSLDT